MIDFFLEYYKDQSVTVILLEIIVFIFGILSVYFAKKENILVYPTGLIATAISTYLLYLAGYLGDMMVNFYFTIMSIYGWYMWTAKKSNNKKVVQISRTNFREKVIGIVLFFLTMAFVYAIYIRFGYEIKQENYVDILTAGLFFTAMWYMALKKIENWTLWIIGDIIAVPLYAQRGLGMLALQYVIFTILAILAYLEWKKTLNNEQPIK